MNFASHRPHPIPRALSLSQEQMETVKTPTPEPQETETRKVRRFILEAVLGETNHKYWSYTSYEALGGVNMLVN